MNWWTSTASTFAPAAREAADAVAAYFDAAVETAVLIKDVYVREIGGLASDMAEAVKTAVINKRAGGMGLISGRKAFQRPMAEGVRLLNHIQDVYLCKDVSVA